MRLKELLKIMHHSTNMTIVNESGVLIAKCQNTLLTKADYGDEKVIMFKAFDINELYIVIEGE